VPRALAKGLEALVLEVGAALVQPLISAVSRGDASAAMRAARIVAETVAAKKAITEARRRGGR
jgi:hypothetical protein